MIGADALVLRDLCCQVCGSRNVFIYPDNRRVCPAHETPADQRLVDELAARGNAVGVKAGLWPYGPNVHVGMRLGLVDWAEHHGVRLADLGPHRCPNWLLDGACRSTVCRTSRRPTWYDHGTAWLRDGKPAALVGQPYPGAVDPPAASELGTLSKDARCRLEVATSGGWYGFGTWMITLWREAGE